MLVVQGVILVNLLSHSPPFFSGLIFFRVCDLIPVSFPYPQVLEHAESSTQVDQVQLAIYKICRYMLQYLSLLDSINQIKVRYTSFSYIPFTCKSTFSYRFPRPRLHNKLVIFQAPLSSSVTFVILTAHLFLIDWSSLIRWSSRLHLQ